MAFFDDDRERYITNILTTTPQEREKYFTHLSWGLLVELCDDIRVQHIIRDYFMALVDSIYDNYWDCTLGDCKIHGAVGLPCIAYSTARDCHTCSLNYTYIDKCEKYGIPYALIADRKIPPNLKYVVRLKLRNYKPSSPSIPACVKYLLLESTCNYIPPELPNNVYLTLVGYYNNWDKIPSHVKNLRLFVHCKRNLWLQNLNIERLLISTDYYFEERRVGLSPQYVHLPKSIKRLYCDTLTQYINLDKCVNLELIHVEVCRLSTIMDIINLPRIKKIFITRRDTTKFKYGNDESCPQSKYVNIASPVLEELIMMGVYISFNITTSSLRYLSITGGCYVRINSAVLRVDLYNCDTIYANLPYATYIAIGGNSSNPFDFATKIFYLYAPFAHELTITDKYNITGAVYVPNVEKLTVTNYIPRHYESLKLKYLSFMPDGKEHDILCYDQLQTVHVKLNDNIILYVRPDVYINTYTPERLTAVVIQI